MSSVPFKVTAFAAVLDETVVTPGTILNAAVTVKSVLIVTELELEKPSRHPPHPVKVQPAAGTAVNCTLAK
ncbi:MAG: hypothetical protein WCF70_05620, partial [Dehalococcoidales bacterium]